jgi:hypothetical protein
VTIDKAGHQHVVVQLYPSNIVAYGNVVANAGDATVTDENRLDWWVVRVCAVAITRAPSMVKVLL